MKISSVLIFTLLYSFFCLIILSLAYGKMHGIETYSLIEGRKLMTIRYPFLLVVLSFVLFMVSCSTTEDKASKDDENNAEATENVVADDEDDDSGEAAEDDDAEASDDDYRSDIGNLDIWIGGEVIVEEDKVVVEGESNLLPGSHIASSGQTDTFASIDHQDSAEVEDDGSFYFEFPGQESDIEVTLSLSTGNEHVTDHYGEHLEKATGHQVYQTRDEGVYAATYTFEIDSRK